MHSNHPETIPPPQSVEKLSSMKLASGAKKVGDHWLAGLSARYRMSDFLLISISAWVVLSDDITRNLLARKPANWSLTASGTSSFEVNLEGQVWGWKVIGQCLTH